MNNITKEKIETILLDLSKSEKSNGRKFNFYAGELAHKQFQKSIRLEYIIQMFNLISTKVTFEQFNNIQNLLNSDLEEDLTLAEEIIKTYE